jgi:hypothetical protein
MGDMSTCELLFQWSSTIKIQLSVLVYYKADIFLSSVYFLFILIDVMILFIWGAFDWQIKSVCLFWCLRMMVDTVNESVLLPSKLDLANILWCSKKFIFILGFYKMAETCGLSTRKWYFMQNVKLPTIPSIDCTHKLRCGTSIGVFYWFVLCVSHLSCLTPPNDIILMCFSIRICLFWCLRMMVDTVNESVLLPSKLDLANILWCSKQTDPNTKAHQYDIIRRSQTPCNTN